MQTSLWNLQVALYGRLTSNINLMNVITSVEDGVSNVEKPYIVLGDPVSTPHMSKTSAGENIVFPLHVWSDYGGKKEIYDIFNLILDALKEPLIIEGSFFTLRRDLVSMNAFFDAIETGAVHGVMEIRYFINQ